MKSWSEIVQEILSRRMSQEIPSISVSSNKRKIEMLSSPPELDLKKHRLEVIPNSLSYESNEDNLFKKPETSQGSEKSTPMKSVADARVSNLVINPELTSPFHPTDYDSRACEVSEAHDASLTQEEVPSSLEPNPGFGIRSTQVENATKIDVSAELVVASDAEESVSTSQTSSSTSGDDSQVPTREEACSDQDAYSIQLDAIHVEPSRIQDSFASVSIP
jgi:hypothetical protein